MSKYSAKNMKKRYCREIPSFKNDIIKAINFWLDNLLINLDYWCLKRGVIGNIKEAMKMGYTRTTYVLTDKFYEESTEKLLIWLKDNGYNINAEDEYIYPYSKQINIRW